MRYVEQYGTADDVNSSSLLLFLCGTQGLGEATDDIIRRMCFACWITKATHTHSEYVILIAFSRQQWLGARAPMLRYMYTVFLKNQ